MVEVWLVEYEDGDSEVFAEEVSAGEEEEVSAGEEEEALPPVAAVPATARSGATPRRMSAWRHASARDSASRSMTRWTSRVRSRPKKAARLCGACSAGPVSPCTSTAMPS